MTPAVRRACALLLGVVLAPLAAVALHAAVAFALAPWAASPVPPRTPAAPAVEAYVVSNGVHTDVVLPVRSAAIDWTTVFPPSDVPGDAASADFVALGWGDREFFLNTPEWRDLTAGRALAALSGTGRSLVHVTWLRRSELGARTWVLPLDAAGLAAVVAQVNATLARDAAGRAMVVPGRHYTPRDAFYEAHGAYDAFTTCNTWTGAVLRRAAVPVSAWTPFAPNVTWHLQPVGR